MDAKEACVFAAVNAGPTVACDGWTARSCGATSGEEWPRDSLGIEEGGVESGNCDLESLDWKRFLNPKGIFMQGFTTL